MRAFVTATGTGAGKTVVTRALALTLASGPRGVHPRAVCAIKPIETGCANAPQAAGPRLLAADARAVAASCGRPELADAPGLYRARLPLAPYAASLAGEPPPPPLEALANAVSAAAAGADDLLVEGAGGALVPYNREHDVLDLALRLGLPLLLVAPDALGVLSHVLATTRAVEARGADVRAVVLNRFAGAAADPSTASNRRILAERLPSTLVLSFEPTGLADHELVAAVRASGVIEAWSDVPCRRQE